MISGRNLLTAIIVGAIVALVVRELNEYGLRADRWSLNVPRAGEALTMGALVAAISQLFGQARGRR